VIEEVETSAITSFLELVVRLNEATFKPLFVRLYDWAAVDLATENVDADVGRLNERKAVLFRVMTGLLTKFKVSLNSLQFDLQS
jgi:U3 small nucleolar RNA-associated protein 10